MKKILFIFILILGISSSAKAEEEVLLETPSLFESSAEQNVLSEDVQVLPQTHHTRFYDELSKNAHNVYNLQIENTNVPSCLLKEPLTHNFEKGPLESVHLWSVVQMNMSTEFPEYGDVDNKFRVGLVNALIDGKFRGGKEDFRIMFDPTPQNNRPFMQQFIQDLYVETHRIPHHTLMLGNSRPGVGIEGAQSPYTLPLANRSQISRNLANVRKFGVRLKGDYSLLDYDLGGYSSDTYFSSFFPGVEFDGWVNFKPLGKTDGKYGKLIAGGGIVSGQRNSTDYFMTGAYLGYEYKKLWMRAEYANADGSNGGSGLTTKKRQGWYVTLGYHITKKLEAILRYDEFDPDKKISNNNQREYTAGLNYYIKGQALKLILNYVYCQNDAKPDSHRIIIGTQIAI
ncbi:hypothetical protein J6E39_03195 [bacterium]|nr:hypothetical protein [bacterium]